MTRAQTLAVSEAKKHGALNTWNTPQHGVAHFDRSDDAMAFIEALDAACTVASHTFVGAHHEVLTAVHWTQPRMSNGYITPLRSEQHDAI